MVLAGAPTREAVVRARVVSWAQEVPGLGAQRPEPEARCPPPRAVMEHWAVQAAWDRAARAALDRVVRRARDRAVALAALEQTLARRKAQAAEKRGRFRTGHSPSRARESTFCACPTATITATPIGWFFSSPSPGCRPSLLRTGITSRLRPWTARTPSLLRPMPWAGPGPGAPWTWRSPMRSSLNSKAISASTRPESSHRDSALERPDRKSVE